MARTRSKPAPQAKETTSPSTIKPPLSSTTNPPKLFVLPRDTAKNARIVTLNNPATSTPSRYYFCPRKGFYEFTRIAAPRKDCRSWLITGDADHQDGDAENKDHVRIGSGYITSAADLFIATPMDALFLLLPVLAPTSGKDTRQHFLAADDYLDMLSSSSPHWRALLAQHHLLRGMLETRLRAVCDTVEAGEDSMYRISPAKLAAILYQKAQCMVKNGLPPSLEDRFVTAALQVPVMSVQREATAVESSDTNLADNSTTDSKATNSTAPETIATDSTATDSTDANTTPPSIPPLLRLHTSLTYLTKTYLPPALHPALDPHLAPHFTPLTAHLAHLSSLRAQAAALRSLSDNISRKRAADILDDDDDRAAAREAKQRKREEEDKKMRAQGRALKQLGKVDTSGMRKMSSFFTKVAKDKVGGGG